MALYRSQISFVYDTALPRDAVTINPHHRGDNPQALADALKTNLVAHPGIGSFTPFNIKVYDALKAPPSHPLATASQTGSPTVSSGPREVALCLSYYSGQNLPRNRGRLYIPSTILAGTLALRPTQAQIDNCILMGQAMRVPLQAGIWIVFSKVTNDSGGDVNHYWVDNEWDTVRSRGMKSTARTNVTIP